MFIYLLTPWSKILLEKLTGSELVKFPALYWNRRFITEVFPILSQLNPVHTYTFHCLHIHLTIILPPTPVFQVVSFPQVSSPKPCIHFFFSSIPATRPSHHLIPPKILGEEYRSLSSSLRRFLHSSVTSCLLDPNILLNPYYLFVWGGRRNWVVPSICTGFVNTCPAVFL